MHKKKFARQTSILSLAAAMGQLYPEQEVPLVREKAREVASFFQLERFATKNELTKMSQMSAECAKVFPPDFASVDATEVVQQVMVDTLRLDCAWTLFLNFEHASIPVLYFLRNFWLRI
jgi:hypothetical protein